MKIMPEEFSLHYIMDDPSLIKRSNINDVWYNGSNRHIYNEIQVLIRHGLVLSWEGVKDRLHSDHHEKLENILAMRDDAKLGLQSQCLSQLRYDYMIRIVQNGISRLMDIASESMDVDIIYNNFTKLYNHVTDNMNLTMNSGQATIKRPSEYKDQLGSTHEGLMGEGMRTLPQLSDLYRIVPGTVQIVTGIPGHGKSSFMDIIIGETVDRLKWCIWSPEPNRGIQMMRILSQARGENMRGKVLSHIGDIDDRLSIIDTTHEMVSLEQLLTLMDKNHATYGTNVFLLDPWNKIKHNRSRGESKHDYVERVLPVIEHFCKKRGVTVIIVAHPTKSDEKYIKKNSSIETKPTLYSVDGSAHWYNMPDMGIVIFKDEELGVMEVDIQKCRQIGDYGAVGSVYLRYKDNIATEVSQRERMAMKEAMAPSNGKKAWRPEQKGPLPSFLNK